MICALLTWAPETVEWCQTQDLGLYVVCSSYTVPAGQGAYLLVALAGGSL